MPRQGSIVLCNTGWLGRPAGVDSNGDGDEWIDVLLAQLPLDQCRHFVIPSSTSCTACLLRPVPFDVRLHIKRPLLSLSLLLICQLDSRRQVKSDDVLLDGH